ncbi:DNA cytosine methyltransferase [Lunatibacter salilacus]|uniref:DNA cytosine methyltransferase n=1 Tax=Lunatibacter salilacus TaxID=2483804 RepID=UPI00131D7C9F|nr:DNA cytosine methyltransferase [Lunatibacter salilacus]
MEKIDLKAVDFFCGAGGVSCGFKNIGIKVLAGIDIDPKFKRTYEENNGAGFLNMDVSNLAPDKLCDYIPIEKNDNNLIFVGCSPCQYYSNLKSDKTKSKQGRLLLEDFKEFVLHYLPGFVLIENVPGLETKAGSPLHNFKKALSGQGYVFDQKILNAKYFGVPQNRRRFVLVASRISETISLPNQNLRKEQIVSVKDAIGNYEQFPKIAAGNEDKSNFLHATSRLSKLNLERLKHTPKDGGSRKAWASNENLQLACYKNHDGHHDVYGRMFWNKPAPTLTTRFIYTSTGRYSHPEQNRGISLREGATLQTFPLNYNFYSSNKGVIATMIGNAVPPKLAEAIGQALIEHWDRWQNLEQKQEL